MTRSPLDKLQDLFSRKDAAPGMSDEKYRQSLERALSESSTGGRLLRVAMQQRIAIQIVPGKGSAGYLPENRAVFISKPPELSTVPPEIVLELGAFLRQAELQILGVKNPVGTITSLDDAIAFDSKIVDNLVTMCKIASELYEKGKTEFVDALLRMGHGDMYRAFIENGPGDHLVDIYYKVYGEQA